MVTDIQQGIAPRNPKTPAAAATKRNPEIAVPEPDLTPGALIARAVALRPRLQEEQNTSDEAGTYSVEMHEEFVNAGFYRTLQPRLFGGYEFGYETFARLQIEIGRGHPGAAWCLGLGASHSATIAAHWPEAAQGEFFGPAGHFVAPHRAVPSGTAVKVSGGYNISGIWRYSSGVPYSTHFIGTTLIEDGADEPLEVNFVVSRDKYKILDDWGGDRVLGLRASGSNSVELEEVFVPDHHISPYVAFYTRHDFSSGTPGTELHGNPLYLGQLMGPYMVAITAPIIGAARAALDEYEKLTLTQQTVFSPFVPRYLHEDHQRNLGNALTLADAAQSILVAVCQRHEAYSQRWAESGTPFTVEENLRLWGMCQTAGRMASEAVELLFRTAGSSVARKNSKLVRYLNDAMMYRTHGSAQTPEFGAVIGRVRLGQPARFLDI